MARLWSCGFELQSVTAGVEFDASNSTGTKSISTSVKRGGSASLRVNPSSAYWFLGHQFRSNSSTSKIWIRFFIYVGTLPSTVTSICAITASTTGGNSGAQLRLNTNGTIELGYYNGAWNTIGTSSFALTTGVFYQIDLTYDDSVANNTATLYIENVQQVTGNGNNLGGNGCIQLGAIFNTTTMDINFDDVAINDGAGSFQNSFPGSGKIVHLNVSAAGDNSSWTASTGNAWDCIDEVPPSDTDYIQTSTVNAISDFNVQDLTEDSNITVNVVAVGARHANDTASSSSAYQLRIKKAASGTVSASGDIIPNTTTYQTHTTSAPHVHQLVTYQDPDSANWTLTTLNSMQIGVKETVDSTRKLRVSKLWAMVDYSPALVEKISDNFNDNSTDANKWNTYTANGGSIAETNKQVQYQLAATTNGSWAGYYSKYLYSLIGSAAYIRFTSAKTGNSWLDLTLSNEGLPIVDNFVAIGVDIGRQKLQAVKEITGADTVLTEIDFDPNVHKWGRLRESGGTLYWEYATDKNGPWTTLYSASPPVPISNVYVVLDDYEYDGASTPALHKLDNFNTKTEYQPRHPFINHNNPAII